MKKETLYAALLVVIFASAIIIWAYDKITQGPDTPPPPSDITRMDTGTVDPSAIAEQGATTIQASDGTQLVADYYPAGTEQVAGGVVLVHKLGDSRVSWKAFARTLNDRGYAVLAIDLRGHGDSEGSWRSFSEDDFRAMPLDVRAAREYLTRQIPGKKIAVIGASIGANSALADAARSGQSAAVVLLSPGLEYKGLDVEDDIARYRGPLLIAASSEDTYSFASSQQMAQASPSSDKAMESLANAGHGAEMMEKDPKLERSVLEFLADHL